ncbi:glutamate receptor ionotropic, NMDA 3B-like [Schistocerca gregaria]|uniref:glutamate receptor ionotropic, NMDA 3B-like n=1 Tax=Schistocerca gregaria TaxID=7010 RepID=UPI00211F0F5B|nr:glutamate receptor ionotropic, NMDA 3B-like [Schistocerca gregaria]
MQQKNFTSNFIDMESSGHQAINGSWTGVMGALTTGAADVSATLSYMSSQRAHSVRFIYPLFSTKFVAVVQQPRSAAGWRLYGSPFEARLWLVMAVMLAAASALMYFTVRTDARLQPHSPHRPNIDVVDAMLLVLGILCQQGLSGHELRSAASRLAALSVLVPAVVLSAAFSAKLVSSLAVRRVESAFSNVDEMQRLGRFRFAVIEHSAAHVIFLTSSDETLRAIYWSPLLVLPSRAAALHWVCSDSSNVLVDGGSYLSGHLGDIACTLMAVPLDMPGITITAAAAPNSSYGDFFNYVYAMSLLTHTSPFGQKALRILTAAIMFQLSTVRK